LNPAVTMAHMAYGNTKVTTGILMIQFQILGGLLAGESAYLISNDIGTWTSDPSYNKLDAVIPNLNFDTFLGGVFNIHVSDKFNWLKNAPVGTD